MKLSPSSASLQASISGYTEEEPPEPPTTSDVPLLIGGAAAAGLALGTIILMTRRK